MTSRSSRRSGAPGRQAATAVRPGVGQDKSTSGLRITVIAATVMLLLQAGIGVWLAQKVTVPSSDLGTGIFTAAGRAITKGPAMLTVHVVLGLLLLITAISVTIRAILARRTAVLIVSVIGLAAVAAADISGAKFVSSGLDRYTSQMSLTGTIAFVCYLLCLILVRSRRRGR